MEEEKHQEIKRVMAEFLGVEPEDINNEDTLGEDLHLGAQKIPDLMTHLNEAGYEIDENDFQNIDTVDDLLEHFS